MSKRIAFTFLKAAIVSGFVAAHCGALAVSLTDQDEVASSIPDQTYYPQGYRALRLAAQAIEQEENAPASSAPAGNERPVTRPPAWSRHAAEAAPRAAPSNPPLRVREGFSVMPPPLELVPCGWEPDLTASEPDEAVLEYAARRVAYVDHRLRTHGIPPYMFEGLVGDYERAMLRLALEAPRRARIDAVGRDGNAVSRLAARLQPLDATLVLNLEARRVRQRDTLPAIVLHGGCGRFANLPYAPSYVRTIPADGRVWLIPAFRFHVCRNTANGPDPWSVEGCRGWREVGPDQASLLVGRHRYQARWRDGGASRGDRTFEALGREPVVVQLRRD